MLKLEKICFIHKRKIRTNIKKRETEEKIKLGILRNCFNQGERIIRKK